MIIVLLTLGCALYESSLDLKEDSDKFVKFAQEYLNFIDASLKTLNMKEDTKKKCLSTACPRIFIVLSNLDDLSGVETTYAQTVKKTRSKIQTITL